jgi:hypothetical protein
MPRFYKVTIARQVYEYADVLIDAGQVADADAAEAYVMENIDRFNRDAEWEGADTTDCPLPVAINVEEVP